MGLTGVIFGVIAVIWLVYLVPYFLARRADPAIDDEIDSAAPFSASVTIVRRGTSLDRSEEGTAQVSTPLTRRAALRELTLIDQRAASRRRTVLLALALSTTLVGAVAIFGLIPRWAPSVPLGLIVAFLVVARFSVRGLRRDLAQRAERINAAGDEQTIAIAVIEDSAKSESVELTAPVGRLGSLWDPIPITAPTYVSKPLAPRTVRTIDLSAPVVAPANPLPVVADAPEVAERRDEGERAAG